jgi:multicomponent K+:H+ antiporter subunit D
MILQGVASHPAATWIWAIILGSSLAMLVAWSRAGSALIWRKTGNNAEPGAEAARPAEWLPLYSLIAASVLMVACAGSVSRYAAATAAQLLEPRLYVEAVVGSNNERAPRALRGEGRP